MLEYWNVNGDEDRIKSSKYRENITRKFFTASSSTIDPLSKPKNLKKYRDHKFCSIKSERKVSLILIQNLIFPFDQMLQIFMILDIVINKKKRVEIKRK
jgi:hypothetical protein